jgi:hypothetical protein
MNYELKAPQPPKGGVVNYVIAQRLQSEAAQEL